MESIIQNYFANNAKRLYGIVDKILFSKGYGGIYDKDELYSIATEVFVSSIKSFDENKGQFDSFLYSNILRKIITSIRDNNRIKRSNTKLTIDKNGNTSYEFMPDISIDAPINEEGVTLKDIIEDGKTKEELSENVLIYLDSLSEKQRAVANLIMENYSPEEIRDKLNLSEVKFTKILSDMRSFQKRTILKQETVIPEGDKVMEENMTFEKSKTNRLSIVSLVKKISNQTIRFNHPLQRPSDQWTSVMKGNLVSDILQGNPINPLIFAEEIINGLPITWDLDGKQRCTNAYDYSKDVFKISKKIRRPIITYTSILKKDEKQILDDNGFPQSEIKTFDISNKKFSQLPEELQEKFLDYNFEIVQYINCSKEDISYHIARYNEGKPMSVSHKGIIALGEDLASIVKSISVMPFFKEQGGYTVREAKGTNGTINRVVIESIMASNYLKDWKKTQGEMCEYLKENSTTEIFDDFEDMVDRISTVGTEETSQMFDSKDSFLYFGLFARFVNTGLDDGKFIEFMAELSQSLHNKVIAGVSFDDLCREKATKDKYIVVRKMELLEKLMLEYFDITPEREQPEEIFILDFVHENVCQDITVEDVELYKVMLDDLSLNVDNRTILLEEKNRPSLLSIVAYACKEDADLDVWFLDFFDRNNNYIINQKDNYIKMRDDLIKYITKQTKMSA